MYPRRRCSLPHHHSFYVARHHRNSIQLVPNAFLCSSALSASAFDRRLLRRCGWTPTALPPPLHLHVVTLPITPLFHAFCPFFLFVLPSFHLFFVLFLQYDRTESSAEEALGANHTNTTSISPGGARWREGRTGGPGYGRGSRGKSSTGTRTERPRTGRRGE